ncbi:hypothetical protein BaRGS_00039280 [Batillaria attramentaria]|uniref:Uncharacterized protein n=1 Tax=Batillaria attramentaria TaxID=370345 RepID=A0ABD0J3E2_9CAEN
MYPSLSQFSLYAWGLGLSGVARRDSDSSALTTAHMLHYVALNDTKLSENPRRKKLPVRRRHGWLHTGAPRQHVRTARRSERERMEEIGWRRSLTQI